MRNQILQKIILIGVCLLALPVSAALQLNGLSPRSELGKEQFIAALYTQTPSTNAKQALSANENKRIEVRVTATRLSARQFRRLWIESMAINAGPSELEKYAQRMADFSNMIKLKLFEGDSFTINRLGDSVDIALNGVPLGTINDSQFFDFILRVFIGPVPLSSEFRDGLLVGGKVPGSLKARFDTTEPSEERIARVYAAVQSQKGENKAAIAGTAPKIDTSVAAVAAPAIAAPKLPSASNKSVKKPTPTPIPKIAAANIPKPRQPKPTLAPPKKRPTPTPRPLPKALAEEDLYDDEVEEEFTASSVLAEQSYINKALAWSRRVITYPPRAQERRREGRVNLYVTVNRNGKVLDVEVTQEARYSSLTRGAKKSIQKSGPFPALPKELPGDKFSFTLPVVFQLTQQ